MKKLTFELRPIEEVLADGLSGIGSLVEQTYTLLREQIINLSLPPESALVEQEVASILKISKTPVREAIIRLAKEGLIQVVPKSGSYVTAVSLERYFEARFVRTQLETGCVRRLATRGIGRADEVKLKSLLTQARQALKDNDNGRFLELDEEFHRALFECAGLTGTWAILQSAKAEIDRVRHLKRRFGIRQRRLVIQEHAAVVDAIVDRDAESAERYLLENIGAADDEVTRLSEDPQLLQTIEDLNRLVEMDTRVRGTARASRA